MPRKISEDQTRKQMIDPSIAKHSGRRPQLEKAGRYLRDHSPNITQHNYNADQIRFLRAVQSVFLQKRHLETADLYEPPLDMFGADAVERWFTEKEVEEIVKLADRLTVRL